MFDFYKLRQNKIHKFKPKVEILNDKGPFILKTVSTPEELTEALRLRYQVFHREMIGKAKPRGLDVDEFDFDCDHLIIIDKKSNRIVGTYRLNCSLFSQNFYSSQEFNLRRILEQPGTKLELGRACIDKEFRRGIVISMLWRGIAQYMMATQSNLLFGCASIKTESPRQAALLYHYFSREERFEESFLAPPSMKFTMPNLDLWITNLNRPFSPDELSEVEGLIPSLCKSYLNAGAYLGGEPAYDPDFKCIDFLTILPRENLNKALWKKYSSPSTELPLAANC
jgi:putative hemolysin